MFGFGPERSNSPLLRHSPAASRVMGVFLLILGITCLALAYGARKAGLLGMLFLFGGAYVVLHGVVFCIASDRKWPTMKEGLIVAATIVILGGYIWFVSLDSSIWG